MEKEQEDVVRIHEYTSAADPTTFMKGVPVETFAPICGDTSSLSVLDLRAAYGVDVPATSPNLLAGFVHITPGNPIETSYNATSQAFFVVRGRGYSETAHGRREWAAGDLFTLPCDGEGEETRAKHHFLGGGDWSAGEDLKRSEKEDAVLYFVNDSPLLAYLGARATKPRFPAAYYERRRLLGEVEAIRHAPGAEHRNRMGILLSNKATEDDTKTLTHTLWALLNVLPQNSTQPPHRHNSVALDLAVDAPDDGSAYTLMGPELNEDGSIKDPIKVPWKSGAMFVTPPGWWHSHHGSPKGDSWVLPCQDAGLHTHMRTLDIRFAKTL